jgi:hypothetical protein
MDTPASHGDTFVPGGLDEHMNLQKQKFIVQELENFYTCQNGANQTFKTAKENYHDTS